MLLDPNMQVMIYLNLLYNENTNWHYMDTNIMLPRALANILSFGNSCAQMGKKLKLFPAASAIYCSGFAEGFVCYYRLF